MCEEKIRFAKIFSILSFIMAIVSAIKEQSGKKLWTGDISARVFIGLGILIISFGLFFSYVFGRVWYSSRDTLQEILHDLNIIILLIFSAVFAIISAIIYEAPEIKKPDLRF